MSLVPLGDEASDTVIASTATRGPVRHVLHVSQVSEPGGLTQAVADLVALQRANGWRVTVACPPGLLQDLAVDSGAQVVTWRSARSPGASLLREWVSLRRVIDRQLPDVVHLHSSKAGLVGRFAVRGNLPTVFSPHAWSYHAVDGLMHVVALLWEKIGARWAHCIVAVSEAERDEGIRAGVRARFQVLPNAVDLSGVAITTDRGRARALRRVREGTALVVCPGRLCRQKGQDVLLDAWAQVKQEVPDAHLVLVGDGPDRSLLEERSRSLSDVVLLGECDRRTTLEWMVAADVVTLPSRWEGMSIALLEAQGLGRAVVVSDVQGMAEGLVSGGGVLVPPEDPRALADELARLLRDPGAIERMETTAAALNGERPEQLVRNGRQLLDLYTTLIAEARA